MARPQEHRFVTVAFRDERFQFQVTEQSESGLRGFFILTEREKVRLNELLSREDEDCWYLDNMGFRLADAELFEKAPWSVVGGAGRIKAISRFMDLNSGEARFCLTPWVRIADHYNQPPTE
jgi:hypothetical protein